jgi:hypothetical protein
MPVLLIVVIIILLLAAAVFLAPFRISLNMEKDGLLVQGFYRIGWLGITLHQGRINPETREEMPIDEYKQPFKPPSEQSSRQSSKQSSKQPPEEPSVPGPDTKEFIEALPALARVSMGLVRSIDLERISCQITFGLNDPAETAALSGYLWSIASAMGLYRANIYIEPYFGGERLDGRFLAEIKARLLWIVLALAKAVTEKSIRGLIMGIARKEMAMRDEARKQAGKKETRRGEAA